MTDSFSKPTQHVRTHRQVGVTSVHKVHYVPRGAVVKIYPTAAGEATVYSTQSPSQVSDMDTDAVSITASTNASWDEWGAGPVTEKTIQQVNVPVLAVALVVTSGTWVLEVTA